MNKKVTTHDSMPWANSSFDKKYCRDTMQNYRLVLDAEDVGRLNQEKNALILKLKELKAQLQKAKESPKVKKALKAIGALLVLLSGTAIAVLISKSVGKNVDAKTFSNKAQEVVKDIKENTMSIDDITKSIEIGQQALNSAKATKERLNQFEEDVQNLARNVSAMFANQDKETPQPPVQHEPSVAKTVNSRRELSNTLREIGGAIGSAKSIIKRVSSDTLKKNPTLRSDLLGALNKLSTAERAVNTNVFESDFTKRHAEMSSRMVNEALNSVKAALNDFNGYETDKDEQAINTVLGHIQSASDKLKSVKVLDSKRVRLDSNADIRRYIDRMVKEEIKRYKESYGIL